MQIDESWNLVVSVGSAKAYHSPISKAVFEANFKTLAAVKAEIFGKGGVYAAASGSMIARLTLLEAGNALAAEKGEEDENGKPGDSGASSLLAEIRRLTMILVPSANGWDMMPVDSAIGSKSLDPEEWEEAESLLVFFTSAYALAPKSKKKEVMDSLCAITNMSCTSSNCADYMASLSKPGKKVAASSVPV